MRYDRFYENGTNAGMGMVPCRKNCMCQDCQIDRLKERVAELEAQLEAERAVNVAQMRDRQELQSQVNALIPFTHHLRWCPALLEKDPEPCSCGLVEAYGKGDAP